MTRAEMLAELREVIHDTTLSVGWGDAVLLGYLAEGQDKFCEETGYFRDSSNFSITLVADTAVYDIPDRVIQVLNVWDGSRKLGKIVEDGQLSSDDWPTTYASPASGLPTHWRTDKETGVIELYPTPSADYADQELTLQVWRYSLYDLAGDGPVPEGGGPAPPASPEVPSRFQRACIEWAAYKAFMHHDSETQDPVKASEHLNSFRMYVSDGITAMRRFHNQETRVSTNPAYRT